MYILFIVKIEVWHYDTFSENYKIYHIFISKLSSCYFSWYCISLQMNESNNIFTVSTF